MSYLIPAACVTILVVGIVTFFGAELKEWLTSTDIAARCPFFGFEMREGGAMVEVGSHRCPLVDEPEGVCRYGDAPLWPCPYVSSQVLAEIRSSPMRVYPDERPSVSFAEWEKFKEDTHGW